MNEFRFICARLILDERVLKILSVTERHNYLNIYFTHVQCQVQLVFIIFELFSVDRRNQLENYNSSVDENI